MYIWKFDENKSIFNSAALAVTAVDLDHERRR
jgi:hypothetical protein